MKCSFSVDNLKNGAILNFPFPDFSKCSLQVTFLTEGLRIFCLCTLTLSYCQMFVCTGQYSSHSEYGRLNSEFTIHICYYLESNFYSFFNVFTSSTTSLHIFNVLCCFCGRKFYLGLESVFYVRCLPSALYYFLAYYLVHS